MSGREPRRADEDDYPEVVALLDRVFRYEDGGMAAQIPNWFDEDHPERYAVVERDGRIVGTVGCVPQTFVVGGSEVDIWGVGNVATHPAYRGEGHMSALLDFWLDHLRAEGVPLAELGGATKRYNRFGWENAGREYVYSVDYPAFAAGDPPAGEVRRYEGTSEDVDLVARVHRQEEYRVRRTRDEFRALFDQRGLETLLYEGEAGPAYLSYNRLVPSGRYSTGDHARVAAELGGSEGGVGALLSHLWDTEDLNRLGVPLHPGHELGDFLRRHSATWSLRSHRMVRIVDLAGTLAGFADQFADRWAASPRDGPAAVTLDVTDADGPPVRVACEGGAANVEPAPDATPDVALDRLATTQLLFGFPDAYADLKAANPLLDVALPLDFYIWHVEGP